MVVVGIAISTTGCIGDGAHGLDPIVVVGFANCPAWSSVSNPFNMASGVTHLSTHSHSLPPICLDVDHLHACWAFVVTGAWGDWAIDDGGDEENRM